MEKEKRTIRKKRTPSAVVPAHDILSRLPPELTVAVLDRLPGAQLGPVHDVCRAWRDFFAPGSECGVSFRLLIRERYGALVAPAQSGRVYLALRKETCHLCSAKEVFPFVYASSNALALMRPKNDALTLFPVCKACAKLELGKRDFDVLVEEEHIAVLATEGCEEGCQACLQDAEEQLQKCKGFLYSDTKRFQGASAPLNCVRVSSLRDCLPSPIFE